MLAVWFLIVLIAGRAGAFESGSQPPFPLLAAVVGPLLVFAILYRASERVRLFLLGVDLRLLTALQAWRVIGSMFLVLYAFGLLPGLFAWPPGVGDVAVGLAAPFVVLAMLRGAPTWRAQVAWLNIAGLIDFVGAVGTGVLTSNPSLGVLPLSLVPTFAVPLWIMFQAISLCSSVAAPAGLGNRTLQFTHTLFTRGVDPRSQRPAKPVHKEDDMLSRRTILGSVAVVGVGLITAAAAFAHGGGLGRPAMMKRFVSAMIDDALAPANVTPEQRTQIYAARDRAFATLEAHRQTRGVHMNEALALFEADVVDPGRVATFRAQREAEHRQVADAISQAITEVHDVLTPAQRKAVADWVRANRPGHGG